MDCNILFCFRCNCLATTQNKNADFSSQIIENFAKRDMFLFQTTIGLRYETSTNQMRYILIELRNLLYAHPKVDRNPARARFIGYGSDALNVELYAYILAADWNEFLAVQEDINLRIAEVVESSGSGFAFPSQTVYLWPMSSQHQKWCHDQLVQFV